MTENEKDTEVTEEVETDNSEVSKKSESTKVSAKNAKPKKPNWFVRVGRRLKKFWKDYVSELKKVSWMPASDVRKSSIVVIVTVVVFGVMIGLVDSAFGLIIEGIAGLVG